MAAITPIREDEAQQQDDDEARWLALLLRQGLLLIVAGIASRHARFLRNPPSGAVRVEGQRTGGLGPLSGLSMSCGSSKNPDYQEGPLGSRSFAVGP